MTLNIQNNATQPLGTGAPQTAQTQTVAQTQPATNNAPKFAVLKVTNNKRLPTGVASNVKQWVGILVDTSSSMGALSKIDEVNVAVPMFTSELGLSENKEGFLITAIEFDNSARLLTSAEPASTFQAPTLVASGGTNFDAPLKMAIQELLDFQSQPNPQGWHYLKPQLFIMSDGQAPVSDKNIQAAHELADVTAIAYGSDADEATLKRISSKGEVHIIGTDGGALRSFLAQVGKTMTATMASAI